MNVNNKILITTLDDIYVTLLKFFLIYLALSAYQAAYSLDTKHNQVRTIIVLYA